MAYKLLVMMAVFLFNSFTSQFIIPDRGLPKRVVNGNASDQHEWPWQVSIEKNNRHVCGGSLIERDWVLTAAHCVESSDVTQYTVVVGAHTRSGSTKFQERIPIKKSIRHHDYSSSTFMNDVALLQLRKPANLSTGVKIVELPIQGQRAANGTKCFITGWGRNEHGLLMNELQEAELQIDTFDRCTQRMAAVKRVDETSMLCAIGSDQGGCRGDSGGPFSCLEGQSWILRGVVSWGHQCSPDYHTVFARVSSFVDWIGTYTVCEDKMPFCKYFENQCDQGYDFMKERCRGTCKEQFC